MVRGMEGLCSRRRVTRGAQIVHVFTAKILHLEWICNSTIELGADFRVKLAFEDGTLMS